MTWSLQPSLCVITSVRSRGMTSKESTKPSSIANKVIGKKDENTIPRPPNAWILYRAAKSKEYAGRQFSMPVVAAAASAATSSSSKDRHSNKGFVNQQGMSKFISQMWKNETDETRARWREVAGEKKRQHMQLYPDYRFTPKYKSIKQEANDKEMKNDAVPHEDVSFSPNKKKRVDGSRIRSKSVNVRHSSTEVKRSQRCATSATPHSTSFSLDDLDWLPNSDTLFADVLYASPTAETVTPRGAEVAESTHSNTLPTTPEMLDPSGLDSNAALGILSGWCESTLLLPFEDNTTSTSRCFSTDDDFLCDRPSADVSSELPPPSSSSLNGFASALDSLWLQYSDETIGILDTTSSTTTVKRDTDQYDDLNDFSSAFLQNSFVD